MCIGVLPACLCAPCACCAQKVKREIGPGVAGDREPPCGSHEPNPEPFQDQQVFLIAKPSLQPPGSVYLFFLKKVSHVVLWP